MTESIQESIGILTLEVKAMRTEYSEAKITNRKLAGRVDVIESLLDKAKGALAVIAIFGPMIGMVFGTAISIWMNNRWG